MMGRRAAVPAADGETHAWSTGGNLIQPVRRVDTAVYAMVWVWKQPRSPLAVLPKDLIQLLASWMR